MNREQLIADIKDMEDVVNDKSTPPEVKASIQPSLEKAKKQLADMKPAAPAKKAVHVKKQVKAEKKPEPAKKAAAKKKAAPVPAKKAAPVKKSLPAVVKKARPEKKEGNLTVENCKKLLAQYKKKKAVASKTAAVRKAHGKPVELTTSEALNRVSEQLETKVQEAVDKKGRLLKSEVKLSREEIVEIIATVLSGIPDVAERKQFIRDLTYDLKDLATKVEPVQRADLGAILGNPNNPEWQAGGDMFMKGGTTGKQVPAHFGSGKNIEVFGYTTKNFDVCGRAGEMFGNLMAEITDEGHSLQKYDLVNSAKMLDSLFGLEKKVIESGTATPELFRNADTAGLLAQSYLSSAFDYKLFEFIPVHTWEVAKRIKTKKMEAGGNVELAENQFSEADVKEVGQEFAKGGTISDIKNEKLKAAVEALTAEDNEIEFEAYEGEFRYTDKNESVWLRLDLIGSYPLYALLSYFPEDNDFSYKITTNTTGSTFDEIEGHATMWGYDDAQELYEDLKKDKEDFQELAYVNDTDEEFEKGGEIIIPNEKTIEFLKKQPKYSVNWSDKRDGQTELYEILSEAETDYDKTSVMDFSYAGNSYWYNNTEGQTAELRVLEELPSSLIDELNNAEGEEEMEAIFHNDDLYHTYSKRLKTKYSYLSDDWNEEQTERLIKQAEVEGQIYGTYFGEKPSMISLLTMQTGGEIPGKDSFADGGALKYKKKHEIEAIENDIIYIKSRLMSSVPVIINGKTLSVKEANDKIREYSEQKRKIITESKHEIGGEIHSESSYERGGNIGAMGEKLRNEISSIFPKSMVDVHVRKFMGTYSLRVEFTLGKDSSEYPHSIIDNDDMRSVVVIDNVDENGNPLGVMPVKMFYGDRITIKATNPMYAQGSMKTGWRNFSGDETKVVKTVINHFHKLKHLMMENKDMLRDETKKLIEEKKYELGGMTPGAGSFAKGGAIATYTLTPWKERAGMPDFIETDFKSIFNIEGSLSAAEQAAQEYLDKNSNVEKVEISKKGSSPLKSKKVSVVTKNGVSKYEDGGKTEGKYGYIAFYKGKKMEVYADTSYEAQKKAAAAFKAKKSYEVTVVLAEKEGKEVTHLPLFELGGEIPGAGSYKAGGEVKKDLYTRLMDGETLTLLDMNGKEFTVDYESYHGVFGLKFKQKGKVIGNPIMQHHEIKEYLSQFKPEDIKKSGGRLLSAVKRDRAYKSQEPHEQAYVRKTKPKNPKYQRK